MVGIEGEHRMPSDGLSRDVAIIHLTDLHFCPGLTRPAWETQILRAFEKLVSANNIEVFGVAVTGDLVDQPGPEAFRAVKEFLVESAERLGIKREGNIDWGRIWLVDGNHDYRWYGMLQESTLAALRKVACSSGWKNLMQMKKGDFLFLASIPAGREKWRVETLRLRLCESCRTATEEVRRFESRKISTIVLRSFITTCSRYQTDHKNLLEG